MTSPALLLHGMQWGDTITARHPPRDHLQGLRHSLAAEELHTLLPAGPHPAPALLQHPAPELSTAFSAPHSLGGADTKHPTPFPYFPKQILLSQRASRCSDPYPALPLCLSCCSYLLCDAPCPISVPPLLIAEAEQKARLNGKGHGYWHGDGQPVLQSV